MQVFLPESSYSSPSSLSITRMLVMQSELVIGGAAERCGWSLVEPREEVGCDWWGPIESVGGSCVSLFSDSARLGMLLRV